MFPETGPIGRSADRLGATVLCRYTPFPESDVPRKEKLHESRFSTLVTLSAPPKPTFVYDHSKRQISGIPFCSEVSDEEIWSLNYRYTECGSPVISAWDVCMGVRPQFYPRSDWPPTTIKLRFFTLALLSLISQSTSPLAEEIVAAAISHPRCRSLPGQTCRTTGCLCQRLCLLFPLCKSNISPKQRSAGFQNQMGLLVRVAR